MDVIVVHYDEIAIKGKNRSQFENILVDNIKTKLGRALLSAKREFGQIILETGEEDERVKDILTRIPGISHFSFAKKLPHDINLVKKEIIGYLKDKSFDSFKVLSQRHNKEYPLDSMALNKLLGQLVVDTYGKKVNLNTPDLTLKVEISDKFAYISSEDIFGVGGLPTNRKQRVVALLSGGFDSPVAAYLMMKRGCEVIFVHFSNKNQSSQSVQDKIVQLTSQLSKYQIKTKLYIVAFEKIQKEIIMNVHSTIRMLLYRRFMIKIAGKIVEENKAQFLVVGDSLSQVASQTIENLSATYKDSSVHILSPLIGMDKREIIPIARKIGTYTISKLPYGDCCSFILAEHPKLNASYGLVKENEDKFDCEKLINEALEKADIKEF